MKVCLRIAFLLVFPLLAGAAEKNSPAGLPRALEGARLDWLSSGALDFVLSRDGGEHYEEDREAVRYTPFNDPMMRDGSVLPSMTADPTFGNLYAVLQALDSGNPRIMFMKSADQGETWSAPFPVSDNPPGSPVINPAVSVSADGRYVTVSFYDKRNDPSGNFLIDLYPVFFSFNRESFNFYIEDSGQPRRFIDLETEAFWTIP